jgi:hypothetical protein
MTTTACVWKSGSLIVEIATFRLAGRTISSQLVFPPQIVILSGAKDLLFDRATALPGSNESMLVSNARSGVLTAGVHLCRISSQT